MRKNLQMYQDEKYQKNGVNTTIDFIAISLISEIVLVKKTEIRYCQSVGKYTTFYLTDGRKIDSSTNIGVYERLLYDAHFVRIHRSFIINLNHLFKIEKVLGWICIMECGYEIPVSRLRKEELLFKINLKV